MSYGVPPDWSAPAAPFRATLHFRNCSLAGRSYKLPVVPGSIHLGRDPGCEVAFDPQQDRVVGRRHARIDVRPDGLFLVDLNSRNGTFLSGRAVQGEVPLHNGDSIGLGEDGPIVVVAMEEAAQPPLPQAHQERTTVLRPRGKGEAQAGPASAGPPGPVRSPVPGASAPPGWPAGGVGSPAADPDMMSEWNAPQTPAWQGGVRPAPGQGAWNAGQAVPPPLPGAPPGYGVADPGLGGPPRGMPTQPGVGTYPPQPGPAYPQAPYPGAASAPGPAPGWDPRFSGAPGPGAPHPGTRPTGPYPSGAPDPRGAPGWGAAPAPGRSAGGGPPQSLWNESAPVQPGLHGQPHQASGQRSPGPVPPGPHASGWEAASVSPPVDAWGRPVSPPHGQQAPPVDAWGRPAAPPHGQQAPPVDAWGRPVSPPHGQQAPPVDAWGRPSPPQHGQPAGWGAPPRDPAGGGRPTTQPPRRESRSGFDDTGAFHNLDLAAMERPDPSSPGREQPESLWAAANAGSDAPRPNLAQSPPSRAQGPLAPHARSLEPAARAAAGPAGGAGRPAAGADPLTSSPAPFMPAPAMPSSVLPAPAMPSSSVLSGAAGGATELAAPSRRGRQMEAAELEEEDARSEQEKTKGGEARTLLNWSAERIALVKQGAVIFLILFVACLGGFGLARVNPPSLDARPAETPAE